MGKLLLTGGAIVVVIVTAVMIQPEKSPSASVTIDEANQKVTVYKSPTCGCCGNYISYLEREGFDVETIQTQEMDEIKDRNGVPHNMRSCHTSVFGDYIVEGHIPLAAVEKLLIDKPQIRGIAMPGMPQGSPGMPGPKQGEFIVYSLNNDGSTSEFIRL
jgi:hypothetical protein